MYADSTELPDVLYIPNDYYVEDDQNLGYWRESSWGQNYPDMWGLQITKTLEAWNEFDDPVNDPGKGVVVAVIDTGVDYNHPDLAGNIWVNEDEIPDNGIDDDGNGYIDDVYGYDFAYGDSDPMDDNGHGTHVSGTIAAKGNNDCIGIAGVAPNATIMALKGLGVDGSGTTSNLAEAIIYAVDKGAKVLNNSWGGVYTQTIADAFEVAYAAGCVSVAAAGNDNNPVSNAYPANLDSVIAVSAVNPNDERCTFSNYGAGIEVAAPGGDNTANDGSSYLGRNILSLRSDNNGYPIDMYGGGSCIVGDEYYRARGTSMACPHVAGVAALVFSKNPQLSGEEVRSVLQVSCDDLGEAGRDQYFGYGRVSAYRALADCGRVSIAITSPQSASFVRGDVIIEGSAYMERKFSRYDLWYASKDLPNSRTLIPPSSSGPVEDGVLAVWNTEALDDAGVPIVPDGTYIITLELVDINNILISSRSVEVNVDNINDAPIITLTDKLAMINKPLTFSIDAFDPDDPAKPGGQIVSCSVNPPWDSYLDPSTRIFSWQPSIDDKGSYQLTFTVWDGDGLEGLKTIRLSTLYVEETPLTTDFGIHGSADMYKNKVIWLSTHIAGRDQHIYIYDLSHPQDGAHQLTSTPLNDLYYYPCLGDNHIVWSTYVGGSVTIFVMTLTDGSIVPLNTNGVRSGEYGMSFYGSKIAYSDERAPQPAEGNSDIYIYDLLTDEERQVVANPNDNEVFPAISECNIAWSRWFENDIYMCDILPDGSIGPKTMLVPATFGIGKVGLCIYKDKTIAWVDYINADFDNPSNSDIYACDIAQRKIVAVCTHPAKQTIPRIYGNVIGWTDWRSGTEMPESNVHIYDLDYGCEVQITDYSGRQALQDIYEDKIIWSDSRDYQLYLGRLCYAPVITSIGPTTALPGTLITITGKNFGYNRYEESEVVFANEVKATEIISWCNTELKCKMPEGAQTGEVKVVTLGGESNGVEITIANHRPSVDELDPRDSMSQAGEKVSIATTFGDPDGLKNLEHIRLVIGNAKGTYFYYHLRKNKLYMYNAVTGWSDGYAPGTGDLIETRYAILYPAETTVVPSAPYNNSEATTITVKWKVAFTDEFAGLKHKLYGGAVDYGAGGNNRLKVYREIGSWTVTNNAPSAPSDLSYFIASYRRIDLSWKDNSDNETGFKIERKEQGGGEFSQIGTVGENVTGYGDRSIDRSKTYVYQIRAVKDSMESDPSNSVIVTSKKPVIWPPWLRKVGAKLLISGYYFGELDNAHSKVQYYNGGWKNVTIDSWKDRRIYVKKPPMRRWRVYVFRVFTAAGKSRYGYFFNR